MTTKDIRTRMMTYIADVEPKKLKALYTLLVEDDDKKPFTIPDEEWVKIEEERAKHLRGEGKSYTWEEAKAIIRSKVKAK